MEEARRDKHEVPRLRAEYKNHIPAATMQDTDHLRRFSAAGEPGEASAAHHHEEFCSFSN
jgi:hypothetical protein